MDDTISSQLEITIETNEIHFEINSSERLAILFKVNFLKYWHEF